MGNWMPKLVLAFVIATGAAGCAKKLKAPEVNAPQSKGVTWKQETPTVAPTVAPTAVPTAETVSYDEALKWLKQARDDIAAATDVTPDLIEAQALLDAAKKLLAGAEASMEAKKYAEVVPQAKEASEKAREAEDMAKKAKAEKEAADCAAADARIKAATADLQEAKAAGADAWAKDLIIEAEANLAKAQALYTQHQCVEAAEAAVLASQKAKAALAAKPAPTAPPKNELRYKVKPGDCLWRIAEMKKIYSDPWVWPLIYQTNRDQITDPNLIFPGQLFLIPKDSTPDQVKGAVSQAQAAPWPRKK